MRHLGKGPAGVMNSMREAGLLAIVARLCTLFHAHQTLGANTTYGEDPVPDAHRVSGSMSMGYGVDPIPLESPLARFQTWRSRFSGRSQGARESSQPSCPPIAGNKTAPRTVASTRGSVGRMI